MAGVSLISTQNHVESPFIIVKIGKYTFGHCTKAYSSKLETNFTITHPNFMESLNIVKVNGAVNTYTLTMTYAITQFDDPNMLEKVFSSIANNRMIKLSYGDWNVPSFIYKEEEAIITKLTTNVDMKSSKITYVINCTSTTVSLTAGSFSFTARREKPSTVLIELLQNEAYSISSIFTGMSNINTVLSNNLIATDDQEVLIEAKTGISILDYISYLVSCMVFKGDAATGIKHNCYFWSTYDDIGNKFGGTYFKVVRVQANTTTKVSYNTYEVDVGYPGASCVVDFSLNNDDSWAILYDYSKKINLPESSYYIDDDGNLVRDNSSLITASRITHKTNEATRNWWSKMTQFPVTANLTIKGLLRPAMLMSYVKVNTYFFGHKHTSSGLYIITRQEDSISGSGYRTKLTLTRVGGDEFYA